jgi:hypothetical protein
MAFLHIAHGPWRLLSAAATWHVSSQQQARHNALMGSTALAERRREQLDVEAYLAARSSPHPHGPVTGAVGHPA